MANHIDAFRIRAELRAALEAFARGAPNRPGATVRIDVQSPLSPDVGLQDGLHQEALDVFHGAERAWTPDLTFTKAHQVSIDADFVTASIGHALGRIPHISLEFPADQFSQGLARSRMDDSVVYSLMREAPSEPSTDSHPLLLGGQHFPADTFLELRRDGEEIWARAPHDHYRVKATTRGDVSSTQSEPLDLSKDWQLLVSATQTARAYGRFEIADMSKNVGGAPIPLDYNILGWGLRWNRRRQTRFPGVTTGEVIVTKREVPIPGRKAPSFIKEYECYTVDDASVLEQHFRDQQHVIQAINREAGSSALEEVEVWRGVPLRVAGTVTYYGAIPTTHSVAGASGSPRLQPDHRVFVSRPSLPAVDWAGGGLGDLEHLAPLARTLDIAHKQGAAHCDVKPQNVRVKRQYERQDAAVAKTWVVLIDSEAFTQPNGRVRYTGLHTKQYTHPSFDPARADPPLEQLVANDRLGFVAITITALLGQDVCDQVFAVPQPSPSWRRETLTEMVSDRLPHTRTDALVEMLMAPLEADSARLVESVASWSCSEWLSKVITASASSAEPPSAAPKYPPQVEEALASIARAFYSAAPPNKQAAVEAELARQAGLAFWQALLQGFAVVSAVALLLVLVLVVVLTQGGAS